MPVAQPVQWGPKAERLDRIITESAPRGGSPVAPTRAGGKQQRKKLQLDELEQTLSLSFSPPQCSEQWTGLVAMPVTPHKGGRLRQRDRHEFRASQAP